jgi:hypothetical protein
VNRFQGITATAGKHSGSNTNLWYSFNDDLVHWVVIDTELWYYSGTDEEIANQFAWLAADLAAVDRSVTPWVVAMGHKQSWMDKANFTQLETYLQNGGVDLYICGHQHNYQRLLPQRANVVEECYNADHSVYKDCKDMTTLVVGSPGCSEGISTGKAPKGLATQSLSYGYGHLTVINSTVMYWAWEQTGQRSLATGKLTPLEGSFLDSVTLVQAAPAAAVTRAQQA